MNRLCQKPAQAAAVAARGPEAGEVSGSGQAQLAQEAFGTNYEVLNGGKNEGFGTFRC